MKTTPDKVQFHIKRAASLATDRGSFESHWQEIGDRVYPEAAQFSTERSPGEKLMSLIYDSLPMECNQLLASGLFSMLTNPASPWFYLGVQGFTNSIVPRDGLLWLQRASETMYHEINKPASQFNMAAHECYLEYGAFGNLTMFVHEAIGDSFIKFTSLPLHQSYYVEDQYERVTTLYRPYNRTVQQLVEKFGKDKLSADTQKLVEENKLDATVKCIHVVSPRVVDATMLNHKTNKPYADLYIEVKAKHLIQDSGYDELPFMAARFFKAANETYGRGPGSLSLPDVKLLMQVSKVLIRAAQKTVDPPLLLPHDGFMRPIKTIPSGINYYRRGRINSAKDIGALPTGNPGFGIEYIQHLHERIRETWFVNQLQLHNGPQMTATEVIQRTEEKLRLMGPFLGRLQSEFLNPLLWRVYRILRRAGRIPEPPESIRSKPPVIHYNSPMSRSQEQVKANGFLRAMDLAMPLVNMKPEMLDWINDKATLNGLFTMFNVDQTWLNDEDTVKAVRDQRNQMAQQKAQAEVLRDAGQGAQGMANAMSSGMGESMGVLE